MPKFDSIEKKFGKENSAQKSNFCQQSRDTNAKEAIQRGEGIGQKQATVAKFCNLS